jgi:hypothetical protein
MLSRPAQHFRCANKTNRQRSAYLLDDLMQEMVMAQSRNGLPISRLAVSTVALLGSEAALAAQGPGVEAGTASPFVQAVMAILVYGASALIVSVGLIGALRGR